MHDRRRIDIRVHTYVDHSLVGACRMDAEQTLMESEYSVGTT